MRRIFNIHILTTLLFAVGVGLFFAKPVALPYKIAYPVLCLALSAFLTRRKELLPIGAALLLSALGDVMGARGLFIPQMGFFALAHGAYICYFLPRARLTPYVFSLAIVTPLLLFLFICIVPNASIMAERIGVAVYGVTIAGMLYSVLQYRGDYRIAFRCAALLFVFSDSVIAWNRFVAPVSGRTYVIMTTYYLAQYLFYYMAVKTASVRSSGSPLR